MSSWRDLELECRATGTDAFGALQCVMRLGAWSRSRSRRKFAFEALGLVFGLRKNMCPAPAMEVRHVHMVGGRTIS